MEAVGCFLEQERKQTRLNARNPIVMNRLISLPTLAVAALALSAPATGFAKDKHYDHSHSRAVYVQPYCAPQGSPGYRPYYSSRPSVSVGFYTTPSYYRSSSYYYDSYPTRTYYRGIPRASYSYRESASYSDDLAVDVQRTLARRGFYRGEIDGDVGPGTRAAIRAFQYSRGLTVTGRIDSSLLRALGLS